MFDLIFSQPSARVVAIARLALAAVFLVATVSDPGLAPITGIMLLLTSYLGFAALVLLLVWRDWWTDARIAVATHAVDMLFFMIVLLWPEGYASPYFLFFIFVLLSAAIRWGWRATLFTAAVAILLYLAAGLFVARPAGAGFDLQRFIIRSGYLVVLSLILIWFGLRRRFSTGLIIGDGLAESDAEPGTPVHAAFRHAKAVLKAKGGLALWLYPGGEQETLRIEGDQIERLRIPSVAGLPGNPFLFSIAKNRALKGFDAPRPRFRTASALLDGHILGRIPQDQGLAVPVFSQLGSGLLLFWSVDALHSDHLELGRHLSAQLAQLIEHRALISARQDAAIARERMGLARDLHDGIIQFLAGSTYRVEAISRSIGEDKVAAASLQDLKELMLLEQEDLRTSMAALRQDSAGLPQVASEARALCARLARHWQLDCNFAASVADVPVSTRLHLDILQTMREAVANAARHSSARKVEINLRSEKGLVLLTAADDGKSEKAGPASGPWSIRERVEDAGGSISIRTGRRGTKLSVQFPMTEGRA